LGRANFEQLMNRADMRSELLQYHSGSGISESLLRRCLATARTFAGIGDISSLSTSDFAGDGTRRQSFKRGEAPEEERELSILAPISD
jgi:hypothetical protein